MIDRPLWQKRIDALTLRNQQLKKRSGAYSLLRLILGIMMLGGIFLAGYAHLEIGQWLFGIGLLLFIIAVFFHGKIKAQIDDCERELTVCSQMIQRINGEWRSFQETGSEFIKQAETTLLDLDLIGKASLYQLLCVARTCFGKKALYDLICGKLPTIQISSQQAAVRELSTHAFNVEFQKLLLKQKIQDGTSCPAVIEKINTFLRFKPSSLMNVLCYLPILTIILIILAWLNWISMLPAALCLAAQLMISIAVSLKNEEKINTYNQLKDTLNHSIELFALIEQTSFESERLNEIKKRLQGKQSASKACRRLEVALTLFALRNNPILYIAFNAICMIDVQCLRLLDRWQADYGSMLSDWLAALGECEALVSCSVLSMVRQTSAPTLLTHEAAPTIKAVHCAHPLIDPNTVVANSFELHGSNIITGSNMSGKSTFMRCIGVNTTLALMGCEVCAEAFACTPLSLLSSMRLHDELSEGISTFYAEILRIKTIMEAAKNQTFMLVLIDEIFKGTNSADRIVGAIEAIRRLNQPWLLTIVTTHDFELCTALPTLTNYHFSESYTDNQIHFDYQLKEGRCQTTNARHLMRMAGIID